MAAATVAGSSAREADPMEIRYMGFDQLRNARAYRFDVVAKGDATRHFVVTVDLALFRTHKVGIQEGPSLCAQKLTADLEASVDGAHELTADDLRAYADARSAAETRRIEARSGSRRPKPANPHFQAPWGPESH
jgi:hypothetical protein